MIGDLDKFLKITQIEPPEHLCGSILAHIELKKRQAARVKFAILGSLALASFVALLPIAQYALSGFNQSGFYQYFSILFSNRNIAVAYWKEISLSLAESLPVFELTIVLTTVLILFESLKLTFKNAKIINK